MPILPIVINHNTRQPHRPQAATLNGQHTFTAAATAVVTNNKRQPSFIGKPAVVRKIR